MRQPRVGIPQAFLQRSFAVQVAAGEFKDPFVGTNLRSIPGTSYPLGENFSNLDMPADSPYRCGWWYRKSFHVAASERGKTLWLRFGGINYRADIWLNGRKIADSDQVQGPIARMSSTSPKR
ncbi:hypothetical protein RBB78_22220 [Tunturiibacter empetritectus]|uniref:glycosyl hydrolase 2 galactose-binding domain-containing protein n=1 Tax=Tunturiibacter empetritectus TaxID=3069691 RepID=UPI003D9B0D24